MNWVNDYLGIPYADKSSTHKGCDCWGLVRLVFQEQHGVELGNYAKKYMSCLDPDSGNQLIQAGILDDWLPVTGTPQAFDLLVFRVGGSPWHCGLVTPETDTMLHAPCFDRRGRPVLSRCEAWENPSHCLDGVYRHEYLAG